uniref:Uncharacterized protein n=1 Tax=Rhizophora mucronata TaxID=61149 RepID=A0A2P2NQ66_RHIMU
MTSIMFSNIRCSNRIQN